MRLDLYVARRFAMLFAQVAGAFFLILVAIETVETLRRFARLDLGFGEALVLALLDAPGGFYKILPIVMVLASLALFLGLARSSELVVIRGAGRSGLRFLLAPLVTALLIGLAMVAVMNPFVAATTNAYEARVQTLGQGGSILSVNEDGIWLRQGDLGAASENGLSGPVVIHADRASLDGTELTQASFLVYDAEGRMIRRIRAESAVLGEGEWRLTGTKVWDLDAANPERTAAYPPGALALSTDLTAQTIAEVIGNPAGIPIWDLPRYIRDMQAAGFSAQSQEMWFHAELALPGILVAMVLITAGFTMRHARGARTGQQAMLAIGGGFALFFLRNFGQVLGENAQVPPLLAAWAPPLAASLLALALILHREDG